MASNPISCNTVHHKALDFHFNFFTYDKDQLDLSLNFNFNKANFIGLNNYFECLNWSFLAKIGNPEDMYQAICEHFNTAIDLYVPKFKRRLNNKPPWFNSRLCNLKNIVNKCHKNYKKYGTDEYHGKFEHSRREYNFLRNFLYKNYVFAMETQIKTNSSAFWHYIDCKRDNKNSIPKRMFYGDLVSDGNEESCDLFAKFFQTTFVKPNSDNTVLVPPSPNNISNLNITADDVLTAINYLKNDTKCSIGAYPSFFFF